MFFLDNYSLTITKKKLYLNISKLKEMCLELENTTFQHITNDILLN